MTLSVYPVDEEGTETGVAIDDFKIKVTDSKGKDVTEENVTDKKISAKGLEKGEYTVVVEVGTYEAFKDTFTVVDTTKLIEIEKIEEKIEVDFADITGDENIMNEIKGAITLAGDDNNVASVEFVSDNTDVVNNVGNAKGRGEATLTLTKITTSDKKEVKLEEGTKIKVVVLLKAPKGGNTKIDKLSDAKEGKFIVYGLTADDKERQVPSTLEEVKDFIDGKYGVDFNTKAIIIGDGSIEIDGSILSTEDWRKVKENGNTELPYNITLVKDDAGSDGAKVKDNEKLVKVKMYEDGVAILEDLKK